MKLPAAQRYFMKRLSKKNTQMLWIINNNYLGQKAKDTMLQQLREDKEILKKELKLIEPYIR